MSVQREVCFRQRSHEQEVRARSALHRDAPAVQIGQGLQCRLGPGEDRRTVGLGRLGANVEEILAGRLSEHWRRVAGGAEVHAADRERFQQLWPCREFDPGHLGRGQGFVQQSQTLQQCEVERSLLKADAKFGKRRRCRLGGGRPGGKPAEGRERGQCERGAAARDEEAVHRVVLHFADTVRATVGNASTMRIAFGISFSSKKTSAIFCCSAATVALIGTMP